MPQTEEEHLELENDDDDKSESEKNSDGEVCIFGYHSLLLKKPTTAYSYCN